MIGARQVSLTGSAFGCTVGASARSWLFSILRLHTPMKLVAMKTPPTTMNMRPKARAKAGFAIKDAE